jgi:2-polyprenyl-3-methyl-5-hydroxy-6-metoxy-1,4-benzoquinol methylase
MIQPGSDYLEIGPGHGLFLALAAQQPQVKSLTAWDISNESLRKTGEALRRLDVARPIQLEQRDVMAVREAGSFDAIVIAEVLEHLEAPLAALQSLTRCLRQNGRMFVNVPINSPAPDHIFLLRSPQEAADLVRAAGLRIIDESLEPMSGRTIEQAMAGKATVTCLYIAERDE